MIKEQEQKKKTQQPKREQKRTRASESFGELQET